MQQSRRPCDVDIVNITLCSNNIWYSQQCSTCGPKETAPGGLHGNRWRKNVQRHQRHCELAAASDQLRPRQSSRPGSPMCATPGQSGAHHSVRGQQSPQLRTASLHPLTPPARHHPFPIHSACMLFGHMHANFFLVRCHDACDVGAALPWYVLSPCSFRVKGTTCKHRSLLLTASKDNEYFILHARG